MKNFNFSFSCVEFAGGLFDSFDINNSVCLIRCRKLW